jgi:transcriptional regulator with XRE-family HTH domain
MAIQLKHILKSKLVEAGIGVPTLAKKTSISRKTIENWIAGQRPQNLEQVKAVADYFGMTVDELCFGPRMTKVETRTALELHQDEINAGVFEVVLRRIKK